ncbi:hypothetical protein C7271_14080 [filamentous cyanobacterium CCP5]|nr:hypothetical protein C7271_14080 [filamentous cyanobacterium CCP5]
MGKKPKRLGHLPPLHKFFLNPHSDARFTRCPKCDRPTKLRKRPLMIFIELKQPVTLNKTCRFCPNCDLLIAHKDEIVSLLEPLCSKYFPDLASDDFLVVGTVERKMWKEGVSSTQEIFEGLHDFKQHLEFEPARYMWVKEE